MDIYTLWGIRKGYEDDSPELMVAWDEYSIENNPDGYEEAKAKEVSEWGSDLVDSREIRVRLNYDDIANAFNAPTITGEVQQ